MTEAFSAWRTVPWWLQFFTSHTHMRDRYASPMIGGGWDGWEFSSTALESLSQNNPETMK